MSPLDSLPAPDRGWAYFLDVDGTLIEIAEAPDAVVVSDRVKQVLARLRAAAGGAVALVSGRAIATLDALFVPLVLPSAGLHGLERRGADGRVHRPAEPPEGFDEIRAAFAAFAAGHDGTLVEDKALSVALHFRRAPQWAEDVRQLALELARRHGGAFALQWGKMVVEFRPHGATKGDVVTAFMAEAPFAARRAVFIGDDVTDEAGFAAVNRLGGYSIRVGEAAPSCANWRAGSVAALLDWLESIPAPAPAGANV